MVDPGTALSAFDTSVECVKILAFIIKAAQEVRRLKEKCLELAHIATILRDMLVSNKELLGKEKTGKDLKRVLGDIAQFVASCRDFNVFQKTWEIVWSKKLPSLENKMIKWVLLFSTETNVLTRAASVKLLEQGRDIQGIEKEIYDQLSQKLKILDELKQELDEKKVTDGLQIDYRDGDGQLKVVSCTGELLTGILSFDGGEIHVAGKPARKDLGVYGDKGPRQVKIYKKIAANTSVHPFYGIARASGQNWALFKDLRHSPSLGKVISQDEFQDDMVARLAIAHEVALTVEYLHSIEILVKRLSDKNVILVMEGNVWKPCLIDIERARLFTETTSGGDYDVRYEAIEFQKMHNPRHSVYTDIWSLGILIWECISAKHPFDKAEEITEGEAAAEVRTTIDQGNLPWRIVKQPNQILEQVCRVVDSCCNRVPTARPTAANVANDLFNIWTLASTQVPLEPVHEVDEATKARVAELVEKARTNKHDTTSQDVVSKSEEEILRQAATEGDSTASYLLGAGIWHGVIGIPDDLEELSLVAEADRTKELRARAARQHLEDAARGGVKSAAIPLMRVHEALMLAYQKEASQHREMKSF